MVVVVCTKAEYLVVKAMMDQGELNMDPDYVEQLKSEGCSTKITVRYDITDLDEKDKLW